MKVKQRPNKYKSKRSSKGLSKIKKSKIKQNKLAKKGLLNKDNKKERRKEKRKEQKQSRLRHLEDVKKKIESHEPDYEVTGEEMMDMMEQDDVNAIIKMYANKKDIEVENLENIEKKGRRFKEIHSAPKKNVKHLLPIMTEEGWEEKQTHIDGSNKELSLTGYKREPKLKKGRYDAEFEEDSGIEESPEDVELEEYQNQDASQLGVQKTVAQIMAERGRTLHKSKVKMACLALNITQDPTKLVNLKFLLNMLEESDIESEATSRRYLLLTLLQVFQDLIPGYRIQENVLKQKMKKDTYLTSKQEMDFISYYRKYLMSLEEHLEAFKKNFNILAYNILAETAMHCLGDLLVLHPHFNYSVNIIQTMIPFLNDRNTNLRQLASKALSQTIKNDKDCFTTVEVIRKVYRLITQQRYRVKSDVLRLFFSLRVNEMKNADCVAEEQKLSGKSMSHKEKMIKKLKEKAEQKPSRKQKRERKKMAKLRDQMAELNAHETQNIQNSRHSEIVQTVFGIYFHILKRKPNSNLMPIVLEGLARFSHLINIDFFSDLLIVMNQFLEEKTFGKRESLHCIQTVFTILSGQGEALNIDPLRFYNTFYSLLVDLTLSEKINNLQSILKVIEQMLISRRKKVSAAKVLSFAKRLALLSLTVPHQSAIPVLVMLKRLCSTFSVSESLLDPDPEGSPGMFLPDIPDPEHANSASTALWDMILCQNHYHPSVRILASNILSGISARDVPAVHALTKRSTTHLLEDFDQSSLKFSPMIPSPGVHLPSSRKRSVKQIFPDGVLDLENYKLQAMCDCLLDENDNFTTAEPSIKKLKKNSEEDAIDTFNFYENKNITRDLDELTSDSSDSFGEIIDFTSQFTGKK